MDLSRPLRCKRIFSMHCRFTTRRRVLLQRVRFSSWAHHCGRASLQQLTAGKLRQQGLTAEYVEICNIYELYFLSPFLSPQRNRTTYANNKLVEWWSSTRRNMKRRSVNTWHTKRAFRVDTCLALSIVVRFLQKRGNNIPCKCHF